jgi:uncharacterized protein (DUF608 family)
MPRHRDSDSVIMATPHHGSSDSDAIDLHIATSACDCGQDECRSPAGPSRRDFLRTAATGAAAAALRSSGLPLVAGPFAWPADPDHFVPVDKKLTDEWVRLLFERGGPTWYTGEELRTIGMPVGGICAGQVYLTGDGRLTQWDLFNRTQNTGYGATNYEVGRSADETVISGEVTPAPTVPQGFAVRVTAGGSSVARTLDGAGFRTVRFNGEYPIAQVRFEDPAVPLQIELEAFSPFVPLDTAASSMPVTVMRYRLTNETDAPVEVEIAGWLGNRVAMHTGPDYPERLVRANDVEVAENFVAVRASGLTREPASGPEAPPTRFADFEGEDYGDWTVSGAAFGIGPARGTLPDQSPVSGFDGQGLVNTFLGGDEPHGRLVSPGFTIERPWIGFLIGGGRHPERTCMNLVVDGEIVRTATGQNTERLAAVSWDVSELGGRTAHLEIVDEVSEGWGHVNVDRIEFRDSPMRDDPGSPERWPDWGTMQLSLVGEGRATASVLASDLPNAALDGLAETPLDSAWAPVSEELVGAVGRTVSLGPAETVDVTFLVTWHFPNLFYNERAVGNEYASRFRSAGHVARHVGRHLEELAAATRLWHDTWYDSTLPWWLLDRVHSTVANLATTTALRWANGRFWGWEGVGCCHGTCGHVWNYAHAMARLFPDLECSVREMQDFAAGIGLDPETGAIRFRGEGWSLWAGDSQGGYVLKALREHQMSKDDTFLRRVYPAVRLATEFLIEEDGNADGLLEGAQHQTYDENYYGANTMVGSLYLGALRAAEEMARDVGDDAFADRCRTVFEAGRANTVERLYNGEYLVQDVDLAEHPDWQYGDGCLADQLFGQGWAHQVGLGYVYPPEVVRQSLESIWKYCWAPDIGPQNEAHDPERWFAYPGEAGLFTCTWPLSMHLGPRSTRYRNEIWTGIEYQVAGHMAREGMLLESLAICRGIHERYHPLKHNPFNEIECGDHYARALASWGVLTGLSGFEHHGPKRHLGFAPRMTPDAVRCAFTSAEGWGTLDQRRTERSQTNTVSVRHGSLWVRTFATELPASVVDARIRVAVDGIEVDATVERDGARALVRLADEVRIEAGGGLEVRFGW